MSDTEDQLKRMVLTFRVSELQMLLGYVGKNKTGRKNELQSRALNLTKRCSNTCQKKIKELFKSIQLEVMSFGPRSNQGAGGGNPHGMHVNKVPPISLSTLGYAQQTGGSGQRSYSAAVASAAAGLTMPYSAAAAAALSAQQQQQLTASYPINPDVKLKKLSFYDILAELLKPSSLAPQGAGRYQESGFSFSLTPQQANKIANSRDLRPGKQDYNVQVQMRFCLLETSCEQEDNFPPNIAVKINDKMCPLPSPIPTNKPGVEPKRPSRPVNITALCRISPTVTNRVQVSWASDYGRCYVISVYLVQKLSADDLLHRLKSKGVRIADFTRSLIKQKLNEDADCEIATTSLRCSLMCPLGKMRMLLPCRANTCNHLQCFDASLYLQMNERKPTWTCPVCDQIATYDTLVIDGYFQDVLRLNSTTNEVTLHKDGSWSPLLPKKERPEPQAAEKRKSVVAIETLSDSDDDTTTTTAAKPVFDDSVVEEVPSGGGGGGGGDTGGAAKKASDVEIITLDTSSEEEDDDEDEDDNPPPAKRPYNPALATPSPLLTAATNGSTQITTDPSSNSSPSSQPAVNNNTSNGAAIMSASVASSLAQLPAATTVLATTGEAGTVVPSTGGASNNSSNGSEGAKSDDSWSVGTVDPGKRLVFRKSMSCSSNGSSATTTATANGGSSTTTTTTTNSITASITIPSPTLSDPLALSPNTVPTSTLTEARNNGSNCGRSAVVAIIDDDDDDERATGGGGRSGHDGGKAGDGGDKSKDKTKGKDKEKSSSNKKKEKKGGGDYYVPPKRTSSRATRFQGITWEGDTDTTSSSDDEYDTDQSCQEEPSSANTNTQKHSSSSSQKPTDNQRTFDKQTDGRSRATSTSSSSSSTSSTHSTSTDSGSIQSLQQPDERS